MAETATATGKKPGLLINRNYGFLWFGQAISLIGDEVFDLTLVVWIASKLAIQPDGLPAPWAPLAVSGVLSRRRPLPSSLVRWRGCLSIAGINARRCCAWTRRGRF